MDYTATEQSAPNHLAAGSTDRSGAGFAAGGDHNACIGLQVSHNDPFWVQVRQAIFQRAQQRGLEVIPLDAEFASLPGEEQVQLAKVVLVQELDALIAGTLPKHLAHQLLDAGIPLIFALETDIRHPLVSSPVGLYGAARIIARYLVEALGGRGRVLMVGGLLCGAGDDGSSRVLGFSQELAGHPAVTLVHVPSPWDYEGAFDQVLAAFQPSDPPFDGIFGLSDSLALAGRDAARALGLVAKGCTVAGINGDPLALAAIAEGNMAATVETPAADFGQQMVDLACQAMQGQPLPAHFSYRPCLVTAANVNEVALRKLVAIADLPNRLVGVNRRQEQQRLTQLETSLEISRRIGSILEREQLFHEIAELFRANYHYDHVQILLWSAGERAFVLEQPGAAGDRVVIPLAEASLLGQTLLRNRPVVVPDTRRSHLYAPDASWPATRTRVVVPIRFGAKVLGLLDLHSERQVHHSRQALIGLQALADQLGVAIRNAQLYSDALTARAESERASQLKTRLLANVSYELRTPLNVILGYAQSALSSPNTYGVELPPLLVRDLSQINQSGECLVRLINDLLDLSRAEIQDLEIFPESLEIHAFLQEVFQAFTGALDRKPQVRWRLELPATLPSVQADPTRLVQVLFNLLGNAAGSTTCGHVTLGAEAIWSHLHIWVEDTGSGIAPENQARIFEPFALADSKMLSPTGTGLGLHMTQRLIELHQGSIQLDSQSGTGTTFHIYLPLDRDSVAPEVVPAMDGLSSSAASPHGRGRSSHLMSPKGSLVQRAMTYIHHHHAHPLSRQEIADAVGVSNNYITRVFRQELGISLWHYVNRFRIERAREFLDTSMYSVTEIAAKVGFNDPAYFSRVFRRETGLSPSAYRKESSQ